MTTPSRFVVGIDLGTTNCAIAYVDTQAQDPDGPLDVQTLPIAQLIKGGEVGDEALLPSYVYMPAEGEIDFSQLQLPWDKNRDYAVGRFARDQGSTVPTRLASSAKSWLCHAGVDRNAGLLPWGAEEDFRKISPVEATERTLAHLREAWNQQHPAKQDRLEVQEIVLTVPASFDAVARELTVEAARRAGLENLTLFEEPQAAFYAWIHQAGDDWRKEVKAGDVALVVDIGGGTTDFTIIAVSDDDGDLALERIAVGDHLLLGGDNMDLALAHRAAAELKKSGAKIDHVQMLGLWHAARAAKEKILTSDKTDSVSLTVLGRGRKVIGGSLKTPLDRPVVEQTLLDGFFPEVDLDARPQIAASAGFQELGLPYVSDAGVTRHLAAFVAQHGDEIRRCRDGASCPNVLLFNGGVFQASPLRDRVRSVVGRWAGEEMTELSSAGLHQAVAIGAAYYGMTRRGRGVRIRGGVARSYYVGVESSLPAVPGMPRPVRAVCVVPRGMEEGSEFELPDLPLGLVVGNDVEFRFFGSTHREQDGVGTILDDWEGEIEELAPIHTSVEATKDHAEGAMVPVHLHGKVTEIGTLELWCKARGGEDRWKLEFNVRESDG